MQSTLLRWPRRAAALLSITALSALTAGLVAAAPAAAAPYTPWTASTVVGPGSAFRDATSVAVTPTVEDVFWVAENGSVQQDTHYQGIGWFKNQLAPAGSADPYADIAAVARGGGNGVGADVDVFWVGPEGSIEHEFELPGGPYYRYTPVAPAGSAAQSASLAAVSRASTTWEIFWTGANGGIEDAYHYDEGPSGSFELVPPGSSTPTFQPRQIAAVSRASNTMEVFYVGRDGSIQDHYYYDGSGWNGFTLAPAGSATTYQGAISAVSRASNTMEVWYIGADNSVQDRYYSDGAGWNAFTLAGADSAQSAIAAVAPSASAMNVTWSAYGDGWLDNASFAPWTVDQITPGGPETDGAVTAVSQSSGVNVFQVTENGGIEQYTK
jgi:Fungal fucose-specific lectin